jgi:hypothetical protein
MITMDTHRLVDDYLRRLEEAAAHLQRARRAELVAEIREHIEAALRAEDAADEVVVRNVLERLGPPEEIVEAAEPAPVDETSRRGKLEVAAIVALIVPVIGWLVGIALVLVSRTWSSREKLVGIGLALLPVFLPILGVVAESGGMEESVPNGEERPLGEQDTGEDGLGALEVLVLVLFFLGGLPSAIYLGLRLRKT